MSYQPKTPKFSSWLVASLCGHAALVGVYFLLTLQLGPMVEDRKVLRVQLKGKKPDQKLPQMRSEQPNIPEPEKTDEPAPSAPQKPEPVEPQTPPKPQKHQVEAPKKEPQKKQPSGRKNPLDVLNKHVKPTEPEGDPQGLDFGNSVIGDLKDSYLAIVQAKLHERFRIPATIGASERASLSITFNILLDATGKMIRLEVLSRSQNPEYDDAVISRVEEIDSFGPPPLPLRKALKRDGLEIKMCPDKCR